MILDSEEWKKVEKLFNHGTTKASLGYFASGYTEFSSKKKRNFPNGKGFIKLISRGV